MTGRSFFKRLARLLAGLLLAALLAAGGVWLAVSAKPGGYAPPELSLDQRKDAAKEFVNRVLGEVADKVQLPVPSTVSFSEQEINAWLASIDDIADLAPDTPESQARRAEAHRLIERAGVSEPMVVIGEGKITLMARLRGYGKVLSADLAFDNPQPDRIAIAVSNLRLGVLPIPRSWLEGPLAAARQAFAPKKTDRSGAEDASSVSIQGVAAALGKVLLAVDGQPMPADLPAKVNGRVIRIERVEFHDHVVTIYIHPMEE